MTLQINLKHMSKICACGKKVTKKIQHEINQEWDKNKKKILINAVMGLYTRDIGWYTEKKSVDRNEVINLIQNIL